MDLIKEITPIHAANDSEKRVYDLKTPASILFRGYFDRALLRDNSRGKFYGAEEYAYSGNNDLIEMLQDGIGLDYLLESYDEKRTGWWVIELKSVDYHKDYWGEVDEDWDIGTIRRATIPEIIRCEIGAKWTTLLDDIKEGLFPWVLR